MAETKAVAKKKENAVAAFDYGEDVGGGFENQSKDDISIPFLSVLQSNSPQVQDPEDGGIEGAKPGALFNTVTEEVIPGKEGIVIIPATTQHVFVEWVPRDNGGGLAGMHDPNSDVVAQAKARAKSSVGKLPLENGNELVETFYVYGVVEETGEMIVVAFTSTKIGVYKRFNTKLKMFQVKTPDGRKVTPPLFAHRIRVKTEKQKNNKGEFYNFKLEPADGNLSESLLPGDSELYSAARACRDMVASGQAKANFESQDASAGQGGDPGEGEDIPF